MTTEPINADPAYYPELEILAFMTNLSISNTSRESVDTAIHDVAMVITKLKNDGVDGVCCVSLMFKYIPAMTLPDEVMVALLRNAFTIRKEIPGWNDVLAATKSQLDEHGKCSEKLLRGLTEVQPV